MCSECFTSSLCREEWTRHSRIVAPNLRGAVSPSWFWILQIYKVLVHALNANRHCPLYNICFGYIYIYSKVTNASDAFLAHNKISPCSIYSTYLYFLVNFSWKQFILNNFSIESLIVCMHVSYVLYDSVLDELWELWYKCIRGRCSSWFMFIFSYPKTHHLDIFIHSLFSSWWIDELFV